MLLISLGFSENQVGWNCDILKYYSSVIQTPAGTQLSEMGLTHCFLLYCLPTVPPSLEHNNGLDRRQTVCMLGQRTGNNLTFQYLVWGLPYNGIRPGDPLLWSWKVKKYCVLGSASWMTVPWDWWAWSRSRRIITTTGGAFKKQRFSDPTSEILVSF